MNSMNNLTDLRRRESAIRPGTAPPAGGGEEQHRLTMRDMALMRDLRYLMRESQTQFWHRFGVGQSSGSRFERGMPVPQPILLLVRLYVLRVISDQDLKLARAPGDESSGQADHAETDSA